MQFDELPAAEELPEALPVPEAELLELGVDGEADEPDAALPVEAPLPVLLPLPALLPLDEHATHTNAAATAALMAFRTMHSSLGG